MRRNALCTALIFSALLLAAQIAHAATSTATFTVQITIVADCKISATTLDFGSNPGVLVANIDATNTVNVTCTNTTPWAVSLNAGTGVGGTVVLRKMSGPGAATVNYTIYRDAGRTQVWGDGTSGTFTVAGTGSGVAQAQTSYGRVPPQSAPTPGGYLDTITATVTF